MPFMLFDLEQALLRFALFHLVSLKLTKSSGFRTRGNLQGHDGEICREEQGTTVAGCHNVPFDDSIFVKVKDTEQIGPSGPGAFGVFFDT